MPERRRWPLWARVLVVLPLLVVPVVAIVALASGSHEAGVSVAQGVSGGAFHPVAGNFRPDDSTLESCRDDAVCVEQAFGNIAYQQGARPALALFDYMVVRRELVRKNCHRIVHVIGSAAFERYGRDVAKTFSLGSSACASGYYHGILERAFDGVNTRRKLVEVARELCVTLETRRRGLFDYQCRHGLGHGLMIQTGYDLPVALATCAELETRWDDAVCTGGVFMENVSTRFGFRSAWLSDEDPFYPCARVSGHHKRTCYLRSSVRLLTLNGNDFAAAARTCRGLVPRWATACQRGLGREAIEQSNYRPAELFAFCRLTGSDGEGDCAFGAARTVGDRFGGEGAIRGAALCRRVPARVQESCFAGVGVVVGLLQPTDRARARSCAALAGRHAETCSRSAIAEVDPGNPEA
jgi:hypothetical protein